SALKREAAGFIHWAKQYLDNLSKEVVAAKTLSTDRHQHFDEINIIAHELRGQGGTFGYPLITLFAKSLYEATKMPRKEDDAALDIAKVHIDTMRAVIREDIQGDGGEIGQQLYKSLKLAIAKHEKRAG
ncbi:MAG: response regulator, partial [Rhodospirillaceae bacterium]